MFVSFFVESSAGRMAARGIAVHTDPPETKPVCFLGRDFFLGDFNKLNPWPSRMKSAHKAHPLFTSSRSLQPLLREIQPQPVSAKTNGDVPAQIHHDRAMGGSMMFTASNAAFSWYDLSELGGITHPRPFSGVDRKSATEPEWGDVQCPCLNKRTRKSGRRFGTK